MRDKALNDEPSFLFVEFVAHTLAKLLEFTFRLCVVGVDHEILEMPYICGGRKVGEMKAPGCRLWHLIWYGYGTNGVVDVSSS